MSTISPGFAEAEARSDAAREAAETHVPMDQRRRLDAALGVAFGFVGRTTYYASRDGGNAGWTFSDRRTDVEEAIRDMRARYPDGPYANSVVRSSVQYPAFSADEGAAVALLERARQLGWAVECRTGTVPATDGAGPGTGWQCAFSSSAGPGGQAQAPTLALAGALAAAKAVGLLDARETIPEEWPVSLIAEATARAASQTTAPRR